MLLKCLYLWNIDIHFYEQPYVDGEKLFEYLNIEANNTLNEKERTDIYNTKYQDQQDEKDY